MFKAKRIDTGKIYQVLDTHYSSHYGLLMFLVWDNDGWRLRPADKFVPPSYEVKNNE